MPARRLLMRKIRKILRLRYEQGLSHREIAQAVIGDPNQADVICDRLLHDLHRIELKGRSMRRTHDAPKTRNRKKT